MDLTIKDSKITVIMKDYLEEAIDAFGEDIKSAAKTSHLSMQESKTTNG